MKLIFPSLYTGKTHPKMKPTSATVSSAMAEFRECVEDIDMEDINHTGFRYT